MRAVLVDRVSSAIASSFATELFSRTVPFSASCTSTTVRSSFAVASFPESCASFTAPAFRNLPQSQQQDDNPQWKINEEYPPP